MTSSQQITIRVSIEHAEKESLQTQVSELEPLRDELSTNNETLRLSNEQLNTEKESLQTQVSELEPLRDELSTNNETLRLSNEQLNTEKESLQTQVSELEPLRNDLSEIESVLTEARTVNEQRVEQIQKQVEQIQNQKAEIESLSARVEFIESIEEKLTATTQQFESVKDENQRLTAVLLEREAILNQNQIQIGELDEASQSLQLSVQEKETVCSDQLEKIETLNLQLAKLQTEMQKQSGRFTDLKKSFEVKSNQYDNSLNEITGLTKSLSEQRETLTKLTADLAEAEELRPKNELLLSRINELMAHLKRVNGEHEDSLEANAAALDRIRDLESDLHAQAAKIRELRRERGSIRDLENGEGEIRRAA